MRMLTEDEDTIELQAHGTIYNFGSTIIIVFFFFLKKEKENKKEEKTSKNIFLHSICFY